MKNKYIFTCAMLLVILLVCMALTAIATAGTRRTIQTEDSDFVIVTSFYPVYIACLNLTDGIDGVSLQSLSEPQTGCLHDFQMTPKDMKLLSTADVFVINGGGIESFMEDVAASYPQLAVVTACADVDLLPQTDIGVYSARTTDGLLNLDRDIDVGASVSVASIQLLDTAGEAEQNVNPHAWMSIADYRIMIATIAEGLEELDPAHSDEYIANLNTYDAKLAELQEEQAALVRDTPLPVVLLYSSYAYVALDYNLEVAALLDLDEEQNPSAGDVAGILDAIADRGISLVLAEELYGSSMGAMVQQEANVEVLYLDPLIRGDYDKDSYLDGMRSNINQLKAY